MLSKMGGFCEYEQSEKEKKQAKHGSKESWGESSYIRRKNWGNNKKEKLKFAQGATRTHATYVIGT